MKNFFYCAAAAALLVLPACQSDEPGGGSGSKSQYNPVSLPEGTRSVADSQNDFAFKIMSAADAEGNYIMSPYGAFAILSMLANGANGTERDEILQALGYDMSDGGMEVLNAYNNFLLTTLPNLDESVAVKIANSIWTLPGTTFQRAFTDNMLNIYQADTFSENLYTYEALDKLNSWICDKTDGFIPKCYDQPLETATALFNVIYFKGEWENPFSEGATKPDKFHNADGSEVSTPFMHNKDYYGYTEYEGMQIAELPYGGSNFNFIVVLPSDGTNCREAVNKLSKTSFRAIREDMQTAYGAPFEVDFAMPKFELTSEHNLIPAIQKLGVKKAFETGLTDILDNMKLIINIFKQNAKIVVDEKGTEAAAVTMAGGVIDPGPGEVVNLKLDRPFLYFIVERATNTVLFAGAVRSF
ncbi:MAG: serpin family protein [Candidatus Amulumruptor caecigallinarius]|nr:serpin family protein [Candidatus Amulumruptor caecigallinarius]